MAHDDYGTVEIDSIFVPPDRQRSVLEGASEIAGSIRRVDILLQPIVVTRDGLVLVCGATRLAGCKSMGWTRIDVHFTDETDPHKLKLMELEENTVRKPLKWEDKYRGIAEIYRITRIYNPEFSRADLAKFTGYDPSLITNILDTVEAWDNGHPLVRGAQTGTAAINIVKRLKSRQADDERYEYLLAKGIIKPERSPDPVLNRNFNEWAPTYEEPTKFNFVHCDFPYGIGADEFPQGGAKTHGGYEDDPETYWKLCKTLRDNLDRLTEPSCHFMFWFSMHNYHDTLEFFKGHIKFDPFPLVWHKTNNASILPDSNRGPRRVYETAFFGSRGDRKIIHAVPNAKGEPAIRDEDHMSIKPEPMLKHFFEMFVNYQTRMLDPTAGSGAALRAAMSLDARYVLGLETNKDWCERANREIQSIGKAAE
jgi:ParB-like chromosome segregation protein Spo0J